MGENRKRKWIKWLVIIVAMQVVGIIMNGHISYVLKYPDARKAFISSRSGEPGSYEFLSRGVKAGMTRGEVAAKMRGVFWVGKGLQGDKDIELFIFRYGSPWRKPLSSIDKYVYEEWYTVFYDAAGKACELERNMIAGSGQDVFVDLKAKAFSKK